jgi:hypothetical protein
MLLTRFLEAPTISAVKGDILKLNAQIINTYQPEFTAGFEEKKAVCQLLIEKIYIAEDGTTEVVWRI